MLAQPLLPTDSRHILVIGATGGIGRQCVQLGLAAGHQVTALVRHPAKLTLSHPNLTVVQGDITQPATLTRHLAHQDAIISAVGRGGIGNDKPTTLYSQGAATLVTEMKKTTARRVFFISSIGVQISPLNAWFIRFMAKYVMGTLLKHMFADLHRMEAVIKTSELDWTLIRPPRLTSGAQRGQYRYAINEFLPHCETLSRADLAQFILHHIDDPATYRATIELAY